MMRKQNKRRLGLIRSSLGGWTLVALCLLVTAARADKGPSASADSPGPVACDSANDPSSSFKVGVAQRDITPGKPVPLWGYGARHDRLSGGVLDPLRAKALVIEAGQAKLAIVGMDLGRGPTPAMMDRIRQAIALKGIANVLICGSHTHHGPVIELTDQPGFGKGKFDDAVAYAKELPERIIAAILEADANRRPARLGVGSAISA